MNQPITFQRMHLSVLRVRRLVEPQQRHLSSKVYKTFTKSVSLLEEFRKAVLPVAKSIRICLKYFIFVFLLTDSTHAEVCQAEYQTSRKLETWRGRR